MDNEAFSLWDDQGHRLYLTAEERAAFREAARKHDDRQARTFCHLLLFTGCRISEGLEVTPERFDWNEQVVMFRTLKKRGRKKDTTFRPSKPFRSTDRPGRFGRLRLRQVHARPIWHKHVCSCSRATRAAPTTF